MEYQTKKFTVLGKPVGKGRPKFSSRGGFVRAYTPKTTADYETKVAESYKAKYGNSMADTDTSLCVSIRAVFPIPQSMRKAEREKALQDEIKPSKKPDIDNIIKSILDGLNGVAYEDDACVTKVLASKSYVSDRNCEGFVDIEIREDK
jgi:Holliday junction resolvase RusA-like endonuclease